MYYGVTREQAINRIISNYLDAGTIDPASIPLTTDNLKELTTQELMGVLVQSHMIRENYYDQTIIRSPN